MPEINAKDLTAKTSPASTDSMLLFGTTSNEGAKITVDNLADNILSRLTTKTFANQVGGSSAATILAQLATLNSKIVLQIYSKVTITNGFFTASRPSGITDSNCEVLCQQIYETGATDLLGLVSIVQKSEYSSWPVYVRKGTGERPPDGTVASFALIYIRY